MRCKPGDMCVVVPCGDPRDDDVMAQLFGAMVTVVELCHGKTTHPGWHYAGDMLVIEWGGYTYGVHALPDRNLQPIRPPVPSKESKTWSPKKQTLLTR